MRLFALILVLLASVACANAPSSALVPEPRPGSVSTAAASTQPVTPSELGVTSSITPQDRPKGLARLFQKRRAAEPQVTSKYGQVCGDRLIRGQTVPAIAGRLPGCGVSNPVKIYEVSGVALSTPATVNCATARALKTWIDQGVKPAVGRTGGGLASLKVAASYSCRTRNNRPGAKISEHGKGNAIDISAFNLADGRSITLLRGWNTPGQSAILRKAHRAACGPFGTVLGPEADRYHKDHFHFDVARHRGGAYCR